jgi:hypothetical protein
VQNAHRCAWTTDSEPYLQNNQHEDMAHLFANILPAVCTLLSVLDDWVLGEETPRLCEKVQNKPKGDKANHMIDEGTASDKP